ARAPRSRRPSTGRRSRTTPCAPTPGRSRPSATASRATATRGRTSPPRPAPCRGFPERSRTSPCVPVPEVGQNGFMESLRGKLLIASPKIVDPNFRRVVVYMAEHTDEGAMGLVINRPAETTVTEAVPELEWLAGDGDGDAGVWVGGPV